MTVDAARAHTELTARVVDRINGISPVVVHYVGLLVSGVILAYLARDQWFFFDEWQFLVPSFDRTMLDPHNGHWSTVPMLLFWATRSFVGLDTYLPYVALAIIAHLALTHVLWRIARRSANPWVATLLAGIFSLLGAGAENIFWAFQVGFVGGVLAAIIAAHLVDVRQLTVARAVTAGALGVIAVATAATALPVMVAAVALAVHRHGWRTSAAVFGPTFGIYAVWYLTQRDEIVNEHGPVGWGARLSLIPQYIGSSLVDNLGRSIFAPQLGATLLVVLIAFVAIRADDLWRHDPLALLLAGSAVLFAATTATTRAGLGVEQASSPRYTYTTIALLLPLSAIALSRLVALGTACAAGVAIFILLVGSYNVGTLIEQANFQATVEQGSRRIVSATLAQWLADPREDVFGLRPDPVVMPQLTIGGIVELHDRGWLARGEYGPVEALTAETYLGVRVEPGSIPTDTCDSIASDIVIARGQPVLITAPTAGTAGLTLTSVAASGKPRPIEVAAEPTIVRYEGSNTLTLRPETGVVTVCRVT